MTMESPIAQAKGMGSVHEGAHHWWVQRLTALLLIPLGLWIAFGLIMHLSGSAAEATAWVAQPLNSLVLGTTCLALFHHLQLGLQVVIEDYIHLRWLEVSMVILVRFGCLLAAAVSVLAIIKIQLGS